MVRGGKQVLEMRLDRVSQCVIGNNRNEVEIQFQEAEADERDGDMLSQVRMYFPPVEDADEEEESRAEEFQRSVMERGSLSSVTGNVIVEFSKDQGNFVAPRGKYVVQMYSTFLRMHGEKYDYKIQYEDIDRLFLLHRPDGYTSAVVVSLNKPIRQGNQRYAHLVLQTTREDHTITVNLTEEEIATKYDNQLTPEVTMPMSSLIAKIFKVLSQSKVFVPKNFKSDRDAQAVKCSLKANEGLLYPLEKSFIFIHKPTFIIQFADIEAVEFQRYNSGLSATRNFDLSVSVRASAVAGINAGAGLSGSNREYVFSSIDRSEYNNLYDFLESKKLPIKTPKQEKVAANFSELSDGEGGGGIGDMDSLDSDEEDDDYEAGKSSGNGSGSDSGDGSASGGESGDEKIVKSEKKRSRDGKEKKRKREVDTTPKKKGKDKKDKNAPKRAKSSYNYYVEESMAKLRESNPDMKVSEIMKMAGEQWKNISAEDKAAFEEKASEDKLRYKDAMKSYVPPSDDDDGTPAKKRKKAKKDKNAPKGALSSYIIFATEVRPKLLEANPEMKSSEIMKECGAKWREMSAEDKVPYEEKAALDKARYAGEMASYRALQGGDAVAENSAASDDGSDAGSASGSDNDVED